MDKQLSNIRLESVIAKIAAGLTINLKELSVRTGINYTEVRAWRHAVPPLPLIGGKLFYEDFLLWKARKLGLESGPHTSGRRR